MSTTNHDVLEQNVSDLIESGGEPPHLADDARARIRDRLVAQFAVAAAPPARAKLRPPLVAAGLGLAAAAAVAVIATQLAGPGAPRSAAIGGGEQKLADGTTYIAEPGAKVTVLGPRKLRVEGAVLLDVAPGKGTFVVETARGHIEVLGTRFVVDGAADRTTAAVVRGEVKLASSDGEVVLHAGEQAVAEPGRAPVRGPAPRLSHLVSWAQQARRAEEHDTAASHHGTLFARDPGVRSHPPWGQEYPLPIKHLAVDITVQDQVARVALDQTFHNNAPEDLEGVYRFAIPPDAALQRLAMYVDGKLTESAVVERMRARRIYEELVYRRVDPALLEWAGTGRLNLRIYPLKAEQDKRVMLAYTQSLPKLYDDYTLTVPLPEIEEPVGVMDVTVRLAGCGNCEVESTSHAITTERSGDDALVHYHREHDRLGDSFVLHVRDTRHRTTVTTAHDGGDSFMLVRAPVELGTAPRPYKPRTWILLDDVSASRGTPELHAQRDLIDAFVKELDENDRVGVIAFDVQARTKLAPTRVLDVDRQALRRSLAHEGGVGATDFEAALAAATQALAGTAPDSAMIVYLGDGMITSGARNLDALRAELAGRAQFIGVGVGDGPDTQTLGALAAATGGYATTFDLADDLGWRTFDLVAALHTARATGIEAKLVDASGGLVPATAYLAAPQLADGEELELVAKLAGDHAPVAVELTGSIDGAPWRQRIALPGARPNAGYLPRLWAQRQIAARLLAKQEPVVMAPCVQTASVAPCPSEAEARAARDEQIRREVVALGKKYFLLSRHTSLLVLENDQMYAQYGVTKGAGDTWAPYAMPATIPVVRTAAQPVRAVASDAELVRTPLQIFYDGRYDGDTRSVDAWDRGGMAFHLREQRGLDDLVSNNAEAAVTRYKDVADDATKGTATAEPDAPEAVAASGPMPAPQGDTAGLEAKEAKPDDDKQQFVTTADIGADLSGAFGGEVGGGGVASGLFDGTVGHGAGVGNGYGIGYGRSGRRASAFATQLYATRLTYTGDTAFDDLTAFVPALSRDANDKVRRSLGAPQDHPISDAARALLDRARAQLAAGIYRWGDRELAVDSAHRFGWRTTTSAGLDEVATFDGATWLRRYAELGLDVARPIAADDVALGLAYLPIWIADPAHYARYFDVTASAHDVILSHVVGGKPRVAYTLRFDDRARLVAILDATNTKLVEIAWGTAGPMAATVGGDAIAVGFTAQAMPDATAWALQGTHPGVVAELPGHLLAYWQKQVAAAVVGSDAWRRAQRQLVVAAVAQAQPGEAFAAFDALRTHGGVELGDLVLASSGIAHATSDDQLAKALALFPEQPVAQYLAASRAFARHPQVVPGRLPRTGLVGALAQLRSVVARLAARDAGGAAAALDAMPPSATDLRLAAAAIAGQRYDLPVEPLVRMWDAVATGAVKNLARFQAVQLLYGRGKPDLATERLHALVADLDLDALPAPISAAQGYLGSSFRDAGWELVYATWRAKVMAGTSYAHVMALWPAAQQRGDALAVLGRAAELAGDDADKQLELVRLAVAANQTGWGQEHVRQLIAKAPTRAAYQLAGQLARATGNLADALHDLEAAQDLASGERANLATVRGEMAAILAVAGQLAQQTTGPERDRVVTRALTWGDRWRAVDPGNPEIDRELGEMLLAVGDESGAWRQLSTAIERDPWSGTGYMTVAESFEHRGRVADALPFWQQAIVIDQTNPTPRLRKAQALLALGRTAEGDRLLHDITSQKWHDVWSGVVGQAQQLAHRTR